MPILAHKLYEFYLLVDKQIGKFPKRQQYTIGKKLENLTLELIELSILVQNKSLASQLLILNKVDVKLKILTLLIRGAYEVRALPLTQQIIAQERLLELGKITGGWIRNAKEPR